MKLLVAACFLLVAAIADAQIKKWTDKDGVTHFENTPGPPTDLEKKAKPPGHQIVTVDGLRAAGIVSRITLTEWFTVPVPSVAVGREFHKLSEADRLKALSIVLDFATKDAPPKVMRGGLFVYDASNPSRPIGMYTPRNGVSAWDAGNFPQ